MFVCVHARTFVCLSEWLSTSTVHLHCWFMSYIRHWLMFLVTFLSCCRGQWVNFSELTSSKDTNELSIAHQNCVVWFYLKRPLIWVALNMTWFLTRCTINVIFEGRANIYDKARYEFLLSFCLHKLIHCHLIISIVVLNSSTIGKDNWLQIHGRNWYKQKMHITLRWQDGNLVIHGTPKRHNTLCPHGRVMEVLFVVFNIPELRPL